MSASNSSNASPHAMQKLLDNNWTLLFLGMVVPTVFYTLWGLWDVINIPVGK